LYEKGDYSYALFFGHLTLEKLLKAVFTKSEDKIADIYQEQLGSIEQLVLPPASDSSPDHFDVFQNYEIEAEGRDELKEYLAEQGIGTLIQWGGKAVHQFIKLGFTQKLPFTEKIFQKMLMIPMNMSLLDDDINYVCDCIVKFYKYE
jgi:dTDP-4-amino-4,6-dideoxygalactose transaminase